MGGAVKLIVGLGNPGPAYADTRHNVGFDIVDRFAKRLGVHWNGEKFHGWFTTGDAGDQRVGLLKPMTYVNRSGRSVQAAVAFYKLEPSDLLVISDDLALPVGRLRMRAEGSSGGHNGLQDVIDRLGTDQWSRLRIGIGIPVGDPAHYVLSRFDGAEEEIMGRARPFAVEAVACWIENGVQLTMTRFNGDPPER